MNEFVIWTGWILAVGMAIWKVVDTLRNRPVIKFFIGMSKHENEAMQLVNLTVINVGRRPVNLIRAGFQYPDGYSFDFPPSLDVPPHCLYNMQPKIIHLSVKILKELIRKQDAPTMPKFIYFAAENGDKHKIKIPDDIKQALHN